MDRNIGDPGEALYLAFRSGLPVFEEVELQLEIGIVERRDSEVAEAVAIPRFIDERSLGGRRRVLYSAEEKFVVSWA